MKLRRVTAAAAAAALTMMGLVACSGPAERPQAQDDPSATSQNETTKGKRITVDEFDQLAAQGPVAEDDEIENNAWAKAIKERGKLRYGGVSTSPIFSLQDVATGRDTGFDAGIAHLLAHYILGGENADIGNQADMTVMTPDTREPSLENGAVDAVIATYSVTPERLNKVDFAGPYYSSGLAIMVKSDNDSIKSLDDLKGKRVAAQSNSTAIPFIQDNVEGAQVSTFADNAACMTAVRQGSVDAYVQDQAMLLSAVANEQNKQLKVASQPFTEDLYGIGLPKDQPEAKEFVNKFLKTIEEDGSWKRLWEQTVGPFMEGNAPQPPTIGDFGKAAQK